MWIEKVSFSIIVPLLLCLTVEAQDLSYKDFRPHDHEESTNDYITVLKYYDFIGKENMNEDALHDYSMTAFYLQQYDKALEMAMFGLSRNPRHVGLNRLAFFNLTELKRYDEALQYADALFHKSDSAQFSYYD